MNAKLVTMRKMRFPSERVDVDDFDGGTIFDGPNKDKLLLAVFSSVIDNKKYVKTLLHI